MDNWGTMAATQLGGMCQVGNGESAAERLMREGCGMPLRWSGSWVRNNLHLAISSDQKQNMKDIHNVGQAPASLGKLDLP